MSLPLFISKRYLKSKKNSYLISLISIITIIGITIGVTVLILALTVLSGFENAIKDKIIDFNEHIVISGYGNRLLDSDKNVTDRIKNTVGNSLVSLNSYKQRNVIIRSKNESDGVQLIAPDNLNEYEIQKYVISKIENQKEKSEVIIGKKLAEKLKINPGDLLTIIALRNDQLPSFGNPPLIKQFIVGAIYESGMAQYDDVNIYTDSKSFDNIFGESTKVAGFNIKLNSVDKIDSLEQKLQDQLSYPFYVQSIFNKHQNIFTWLELQKKPIPIILSMVILVAAFNMISTILMIVLERIPEVGVLRSLGINKSNILKIFLIQGSYLAVIGIFLGNLLALIITLLQINFNIVSLPSSVYFLSSAPISLDLQTYLMVSILSFIICFLTSLIPSYIASKLNIIKSIRFE